MLQRILHKLKTTVAGGAIILAGFSVLSRLIGLLRDRFLASTFGAGDTLDVYYAAFRLPDLVFNTLVLGAFAVAFIPIFLETWEDNKKRAWRVTNSILNILLAAMAVIGVVFFILAPQIVAWLIVPGFSPEKQQLTVELTRVMLGSILFFTLSNVAGGVLNAFKRFAAYGLAPIMYNLGIIAGIAWLVPRYGPLGLAYGVVGGAALHFLVQVPAWLKTGFRWRAVFDYRLPEVKKIFALMLPRTFALAIGQVNKVVLTVIASTLAVGSVAVYNLADNLQYVPIGVFAIPLAMACFPYLSEALSQKNHGAFGIHFSVTLRRIIFLVIPTSFFIFFLRAQIVRVVFGAGAFDWNDTRLTLDTLGFFALSMWAQALLPLLARAFYAFQDTKTPVVIGLWSAVLNIALAFGLSRFLGAPGLALGFSLAAIVNVIWLWLALKRKNIWLDTKTIFDSGLKIILISAAATLVLQMVKLEIGQLVNMDTFLGVFTQLIIAGFIGLVVYLGLACWLKMPEVEILKNMLVKIYPFKNKNIKEEL